MNTLSRKKTSHATTQIPTKQTSINRETSGGGKLPYNGAYRIYMDFVGYFYEKRPKTLFEIPYFSIFDKIWSTFKVQ